MDKAAILKRIEELDRLEVSTMQKIVAYNEANKWEKVRLFKWQAKTLDLLRKKLILVVPAPNKIGKSLLSALIAVSWALGYEGWNEVKEDDPDTVKVGDRFFHASSLGIKPPVKIRITGEDWLHHLGQTVVPELKKWAPAGQYETKKNTQGIDYFWTFKNGSTFELMTHDQEDKLYESWLGHGWIADEPPPKNKYSAMSRGIFGVGGKILLATTPLKEAWILDDLVLSARTDVGVVTSLTCLDNEVFYNHDVKILEEMGMSEGQINEFFNKILYIDDKGRMAEQYISETIPVEKQQRVMELYFLRFAKDTPIDQKPSRFFGTFKKLIGLIIKGFDINKHKIPSFKIPTNWIVTPFIDLHLNRPHAISFYACDERNINYVIDEVWENLRPEEIADTIIRAKKVNSWNIYETFIDPLAKGDDHFMKNRGDVQDSFTIIGEKLSNEGIHLQVASKDKPSGIRNIQTWLEGVNGLPTLYFLDSLQSFNGGYGHVHEIQRWTYDDNGLPEKVDDHFMENLYRYTLAGVEYRERKGDYCHQTKNVPTEMKQAVGQSWMGA